MNLSPASPNAPPGAGRGPTRPTRSALYPPAAFEGIVYRLGELTLEPATRTLRGPTGAPIHLAVKPFLLLLHLVTHHQRLVLRDELLECFWSGAQCYDEALTRCMSHVRKALDDRADDGRLIATRHGVGYRYVGPLQLLTQAPDAA